VIQDIPQSNFNQIKGIVYEILEHEEFPSITLEVGNNSKRFVNFFVRKSYYESVKSLLNKGDKVVITFFLSSRKKFDRWYTMANI
jgi:hypothetical protein